MEWLNQALKSILNTLSDPSIFFTLSTIAWIFMFKYYRSWTKPNVIKPILWFSIILLIWALFDHNFFIQASKPDNIPIWLMLYGTGLVTWIAFRRAALNDARIEKGLPTIEKEESDQKVYTWPDLVYSELICIVVGLAFLFVWAIIFKAPLEPPANIGVTPNPAKAPWYFLGLQEMLVYFDPWIAGVVMPGLIVVGLVGLPYFDKNPKGNGYYTVKERPYAIWVFCYGFLVLWIALIFLGTFLRGPSWNAFGPFEYWDSHKVLVMNNVNLSEFFWVKMLNVGLPSNILIRESLGFIIVLVYFAVLPPLLAITVLKTMYNKLGFTRYNIVIFLALTMISLPVKMYLRWLINLKYIIAIPEFMFNV